MPLEAQFGDSMDAEEFAVKVSVVPWLCDKDLRRLKVLVLAV